MGNQQIRTKCQKVWNGSITFYHRLKWWHVDQFQTFLSLHRSHINISNRVFFLKVCQNIKNGLDLIYAFLKPFINWSAVVLISDSIQQIISSTFLHFHFERIKPFFFPFEKCYFFSLNPSYKGRHGNFQLFVILEAILKSYDSHLWVMCDCITVSHSNLWPEIERNTPDLRAEHVKCSSLTSFYEVRTPFDTKS